MSSLIIAPHAIYPYFWTPITLKNHSLCISVVSFFLSYAGSGKFWPHIEGGSQNDSSLPLPMSAEELLSSFSSLTIKKKVYPNQNLDNYFSYPWVWRLSLIFSSIKSGKDITKNKSLNYSFLLFSTFGLSVNYCL